MRPQPRQFVIRHVGPVRETANGNRYLVCDTDVGRIAVWGDAGDSRNIRRVQALALPARVRAGAISSRWSQHALWVPQDAELSPSTTTGPESGQQESDRSQAGPRAEGRKESGDQKQAGRETLDSYAVLGIKRGATASEIRAAYLAAIKQYHPDQVAHLGPELRKVAHQKTQEINWAYETLKGGKK